MHPPARFPAAAPTQSSQQQTTTTTTVLRRRDRRLRPTMIPSDTSLAMLRRTSSPDPSPISSSQLRTSTKSSTHFNRIIMQSQARRSRARSLCDTSLHLFTPPELFDTLTTKNPAILRPHEDHTPIQRLQIQAVQSIRQIWANSTWANRISLVNRLETFRRQHPELQPNNDTALDWSIILFVESTQTIPSSKLTYVKHLMALYKRQEHQLPICSIYSTALRGLGSIPMHPSHINIDRMIMRASVESVHLQTAIFIAWKTASRWDEISRLTKESFIHVADDEIIVEWMNNTKTTRLDPWRSSTWTVIHHPAPMTHYVETINSLQPEETLTPFSTTQFVDWMQKDMQTRHLTAQSIKRGALTLLVQFVLANQLDIALIPRMAKHKLAVDILPATTFRYLDDKISLARMMKTQLASILLPCSPHAGFMLDELMPENDPFPISADNTTNIPLPTTTTSSSTAPPHHLLPRRLRHSRPRTDLIAATIQNLRQPQSSVMQRVQERRRNLAANNNNNDNPNQL